ncbi:copper chaperone PCu(A)C [Paludibacterium sp.]|uniref:copper chaperone PCu(A)C n=1 Tax=Paludibacterium sp. TaxID=1917523 RepID=UPI0025CE689D|nr:copper chaperone PCu(A)C [Paludibacterium sp.]MBV8649363.1 copper chaperone PCu(A)C [Paludibacterium sp.]
MKQFFTALLLLLASQLALAASIKAGDLTIDGAWARSTASKAANGAVYLNISNGGSEADKLLSVSSNVAGKTQIHQTSLDNGMMRMRALTDGVAIAPGQPVHFSPGGLHIMLLDLKAPLKLGDHFTLTLTFARAGTVDIPVEVRDMPAGGGMQMGMSMSH